MSGSSEQNRRFVIQKHTTAGGIHWDWMVEGDGVLQTWRVNCPPGQVGKEPIETERIADHSIRFLTYEGPVQQNTGTVQIEDRGAAVLSVCSEGRVEVCLEGRIVRGRFAFYSEKGRWFLCRMPEPA
jgi:hypothetical protein